MLGDPTLISLPNGLTPRQDRPQDTSVEGTLFAMPQIHGQSLFISGKFLSADVFLRYP